jgi:hypothetical protein
MSFLSDLFGTTKMNQLQTLTGQEGQSAVSAGLSGYQSGVTAAAPALDFLTQLTKGDQGDVTQAAQPQIDQITQQFDQIRNMISMQPRGGGKTTALAEAPFQKAGDIQRTEGAMRTGAAGQLGSLSTNLAGLGLQEAGLGANLQGTSAGIAEATPSPLQDINSLFNLAGNAAGTSKAIAGLF